MWSRELQPLPSPARPLSERAAQCDISPRVLMRQRNRAGDRLGLQLAPFSCYRSIAIYSAAVPPCPWLVRLRAPLHFEGVFTFQQFRLYLSYLFSPTLTHPTGQILFADNTPQEARPRRLGSFGAFRVWSASFFGSSILNTIETSENQGVLQSRPS